MIATHKVKLNLGCGLQCPAGWVNIDSSMGARLSKVPFLSKFLHAVVPSSWGLPNINWPSNVKWMDITRRYPFADNSVDFIYTSHTIEHLTYNEAAFVFKECYRVLKPGGVIRVIVPDLSQMISSYLSNKQQIPEIAAKRFLQETYYFEIPIPHTLLQLLKFYFKRKNNHHFLYDRDGLAYQFECAGFINTVLCRYRESKIPDVGEIDLPNRFEGAICLEAVKP